MKVNHLDQKSPEYRDLVTPKLRRLYKAGRLTEKQQKRAKELQIDLEGKAEANKVKK